MKKARRKDSRRAVILAVVLTALITGVAAFVLAKSRTSAVTVSAVDTAAFTLPEYTGEDSAVINGGRPFFYAWELTATPFVRFSPLDELGRTGAGSACLGPETLPKAERGEIGDIRPSGWHTVRYDDLIEDHYLYNRCHVIGYLLCGDNATPENLFTGTRHLNAEAMLPFEIRTVRYIEETGNHVLYRVTPIYRDRDLLARGVLMEAWSVEDGGAGVCFNVFVFNVQPGVRIDYRTGESEREAAPAA